MQPAPAFGMLGASEADMRRCSVWVVLAVGGVLASGCDCSGDVHAAEGPCDAPPDARPAACDQACSEAEPCPGGFYCGGSGVCTADCTPANPAPSCPAPAVCTGQGVCVRADGGDDTDLDGRVARRDAPGCARVSVATRRVTPNVILVVDQSSSMVERFGDGNRWDGLRDSLMAEPDGLVPSMQSLVRFGLALYSAEQPNDGEPVPGMCPLITWVPPDIDNYTALDSVYGSADPIDETPTGESLDAVIERVTREPDPSDDPTIFILATDGEPDTCAVPNPQNGQPEALAAARRAYDLGIRTFIISVGRGTVSAEHLQDMANAGLGRGPGDPDADYWVAGDDAGLRDALLAIVGGELSCVVELDGRIQDVDEACGPSSDVRLGGNRLTCGDPDGWRVVDETHIELLGDACQMFQSSAGIRLDAEFDCGVILI